jgi:hypothetical protein
VLRERRGYNSKVESKPFESNACLPACRTEVHGPRAVPKVLPKKGPQSEFVPVNHYRARCPCAREAVIGPARSEFAIFVREGETLVESADS